MRRVVLFRGPQGNVHATVLTDVAMTPEAVERGLAGLERVPESVGMLFELERGIHSFWMRGMLAPIDLIFVLDNAVTAIEREVPPTSTSVMTYLCDRVVELRAGWAARHGVVVGDGVAVS